MQNLDQNIRGRPQSVFRQGQGLDVETWVRGSKLVELIPEAGR